MDMRLAERGLQLAPCINTAEQARIASLWHGHCLTTPKLVCQELMPYSASTRTVSSPKEQGREELSLLVELQFAPEMTQMPRLTRGVLAAVVAQAAATEAPPKAEAGAPWLQPLLSLGYHAVISVTLHGGSLKQARRPASNSAPHRQWQLVSGAAL